MLGEKYKHWILNNEPTMAELEQQKKHTFLYEPVVSLIVPTFNTLGPFLCELIESVLQQTYQRWELCIAADSNEQQYHMEEIISQYVHDPRIKYKILGKNKNLSVNINTGLHWTQGDYIGVLEHADLLAPFALYEVVKAINEYQKPDFLYSDTDKIENVNKRRFAPFFKPDFAPDMLRSYNYIGHFSVFKQTLIDRIGGFCSGFDSSQHYDLILRATENANRVVHIPKILYHQRSLENSAAVDVSANMHTVEAGKKALLEHLQRIGLKGSIDFSNYSGSYTINYELNSSKKISIIIPNKDHVTDLDRCLKSIYSKTTYDNYEVIIVENNSIDEQTFNYYKSLKKYPNLTVVEWKEKGFNFAAIVNYGVLFAEGEYVLLLNNDVEVITSTWLEKMVMYLQRDDVGIVGAKLYYPDGTIQHAGVYIDKTIAAGHISYKLLQDHQEFFNRANLVQNVSAVTGACLMIKKDLYHAAAGLDAASFTIDYNDVDLCMKIRKLGKLVVFTPMAALYHHESKSRINDADNLNRKRATREQHNFLIKWARELEKDDPYYNNAAINFEDIPKEGHKSIEIKPNNSPLVTHLLKHKEGRMIFYTNLGKTILENNTRQNSALGSKTIAEQKSAPDINSIKSDFRIARKKELEAFLSAKQQLNFSIPVSPKITILLVLWNQAELTLTCLEALQRQDKGDFEVLIVDNASSDATTQLLSLLNGVRVITNKENIGFLKAVNRAIDQAHGQYLLLLNNDAIVRPGSIQQAITRMESTPGIGAVGGRVILPDGLLQEAGSIIWQDGTCLGYQRGELPDTNEAMFVRDVDYCTGAFLLTPTELFRQMGGFDVRYAPAYYEETDYCVRLWKRRLRVVYDPAVVIDHFEYGSTTISEQALHQMQVNRFKLLSTHYDFLTTRHNYAAKNILYARMNNNYKGRVLFIDDRVPLRNLGAGYPRARSILQTITANGWFITFYPFYEPNLVDDWQDIYNAIPDTIEVMRGYGANKLEHFLTERAGYYDVLFISRPPNMLRVKELYDKRPALFSGLKIIYDAEAIWAIRDIQNSKIQKKLLSEKEAARRIDTEVALAKVADTVLAVSKQEAQYFKNAGHNDVHVLGHALAANPTSKKFEERENILFVGQLEDDGSPNVDSVMWFTNKVLPLINAGCQERIKLYVIGKNGANTLQKINSSDVVLLGAVDDLTEWYNNCRIFVAPTRFAAGIPLKVLEACAHGIPTVLTPILGKQLNWRHEQEALVGETATKFAEQCQRLYNDKKLWQRIGGNSINRIVTDYGISAFANTLDKVLNS
ncbi:glycosyltransferase [Sporomusa sp. KB1]|uniref:glycosyltransferase n=1 Tax=Sporomusa sp. KB1 TaxID=943346 RepID=UPI0011A219DA|nr:glycosyltransferase [Sporomusa sp. KB1]TWH46000.1 GT2 family glycosyltransferase [Sporomusa sp. KB1]